MTLPQKKCFVLLHIFILIIQQNICLVCISIKYCQHIQWNHGFIVFPHSKNISIVYFNKNFRWSSTIIFYYLFHLNTVKLYNGNVLYNVSKQGYVQNKSNCVINKDALLFKIKYFLEKPLYRSEMRDTDIIQSFRVLCNTLTWLKC